MADNKYLLKYKKSIFNKIIDWFKNIFKIRKKDSINNEKNSYIDINEKNKQAEKEAFFEKYNDIKNKKIDINTLSYDELQLFNKIIAEEISLKSEKLDILKKENDILEKEILEKETEYNKMQENYDNNNN